MDQEPQDVVNITTLSQDQELKPAPVGKKPYKSKGAYLATVRRTLTLRRWAKIVEKAIGEAQEGDRHARSWLTDLIMAMPAHGPGQPAVSYARVAHELVERVVRERKE
jgi:hypothetical protein